MQILPETNWGKIMILDVERISKSFGSNHAVKNVSFSVVKGESYGLLGPNGAGKSTVIGMIMGLLRPDSGDIHVGGSSLSKNPRAAKKKIGYVPQEVALYGELSARENLAYWGRLYGLHGKTLAARIDSALETVGLAEREKGRVSTFSGGMKRRINIGAALLHSPEIIIMDEPTVGIDPQSRNHILETVKVLNQAGTTVIYTSHYMEEVEYLCTRIGIIDHGEIIAEGSVEQLRLIVGEKSELELILSGSPEQILPKITALPVVIQAYAKENLLSVVTQSPAEALAKVAETLAANKLALQSVNIHEPNLENKPAFLAALKRLRTRLLPI